MTHAERTLVLLLLAAGAALVWAWDRQQTRRAAGTAARISALEAQSVALSRDLMAAEQALIAEQSARITAQAAQAAAEQSTRRALSRADSVTRESEQALADSSLTADTLRGLLSRQVAVTRALQYEVDTLLLANAQARIAEAQERDAAARAHQLARDAIAVRDSLLALQPEACRVGPWDCPSRKAVAGLTFTGTLGLIVALIL